MLKSRALSRWSAFFCLSAAFAANAANSLHAESPGGLVVPLDEGRLAHMETTLDHFAARIQADPGLRKDIKSFGGDKDLAGNTVAEVSASVAKLHPKAAAAATSENWTPGDFYLTYILFLGIEVSENTGATSKDAEDRGVRRDMEFYEKHRARVHTMVTRFGKVMGY